jgi:hypothetical protein
LVLLFRQWQQELALQPVQNSDLAPLEQWLELALQPVQNSDLAPLEQWLVLGDLIRYR